jgi:predicted P-loop ATPase
MVCFENRFNPVVDYLNGLEWDGKPRLDRWLIDYVKAEDTPYHRAIGRKFLCALVRRAKQPGCKFDHTLVLEGDEDLGKSLLAKALCAREEWFSDQPILGQSGKEQQELTCGVWVYELAELSGLRGKPVDQIKAFQTRTHDKARKAYGHRVENQPRTCGFVGTTNDRLYLTSPNGNRRWWCCGWLVEPIDVEGFVEDRDQIFAEAVLAEPNEKLWLEGELKVAAKQVQEARRALDPWEDLLAGYREPPCGHAVRMGDEWRLHTKDLFAELGLSAADLRSPHWTTRLSNVMSKLGWRKAEQAFRITGKRSPANGYIKPILMIETKPQPAAAEARGRRPAPDWAEVSLEASRFRNAVLRGEIKISLDPKPDRGASPGINRRGF